MLTGIKKFFFFQNKIPLKRHNKKTYLHQRNQRIRSGKNAIADTVTINATNAGSALLAMSKNGCPLTADAANRLIPTGGVMKPTESVDTTKTPKWTGSNPSSMPMGRRIGIITSIAAIGSRMHPIINKTKIIMKTDSICPTDILTKKLTTFPGTPKNCQRFSKQNREGNDWSKYAGNYRCSGQRRNNVTYTQFLIDYRFN